MPMNSEGDLERVARIELNSHLPTQTIYANAKENKYYNYVIVHIRSELVYFKS